MRTEHDLSNLKWTLSGWTPYQWRMLKTLELGASPQAEVRGVPATVPGSVQQALRQAGLLPDWRLPGNDRLCEWVENRHWIFETTLPDEWFAGDAQPRLRCDGLDYSGWVLLNGKDVGAFRGTHMPYVFNLAGAAEEKGNRLQIVFDLPPRWLGQFGYTSQIREWKPRFNYLWDWTCRLVQAGIWDRIVLEVAEGIEIADLRCLADADLQNHTGLLQVRGCVSGDAARVHVLLERDDAVVREATVSAAQFAAGVNWKDLAVELWWPNGQGEPSLYTVTVTVLGPDRVAHDRQTRRVGFRNIAWRQCEGAPAGADPWLCVINGRPVFLQGVDWLPLAPNFADVPDATYRHRISLYRDLGVNTLRVWGGSYLEKEVFYNLCDEHGLLVWQDLMLSSSGLENLPPSDPVSISEMGAILRSFIARRQHHASLLLWCGGNELHEQVPEGYGRPMTAAHPLLGHLDAIVREYDPGRRFIPTTATGPRFFAHPQDLGKGLLGNVHGPWKLWGTMAEWKEYWQKDDALFRAETGAPGAAPAEIIREYAGDAPPFPVTEDSPVWHRPFTWWIEADAFKAEHGREPRSLEEYVVWSQARQAEALASAMGASKARFPRIGGMLLWCGHDCCPIPANTSIIDYHGNPKPAARALARIWKNNSEQQEA